MSISILSVSQINFYIKSLLDSDGNLSSVFISGEISNLADHYKSGHIYFSLKDEKALIRCVMFSFNASRLRFVPMDGMKVIVRGKISLYEATGQYQLYVEDMQPDGAGSLALAFERLKEKLSSQGLFDSRHKKPIPKYPQKIGIVTSKNGAALQDIKKILARRYKPAEIILCPASVQGANAAPEIIKAVNYLDKNNLCDVIIVGRGGGSTEDLWAFNDEKLAYAVFNTKTPIISAVGHETDFTICDFVADLRAATPSAAAELAVPLCEQLLSETADKMYKIRKLTELKINKEKAYIDSIASKAALKSPLTLMEKNYRTLDNLSLRLNSGFNGSFGKIKNNFAVLSDKLNMLSPLAVLSRGYGLAFKNGKAVTSVKNLKSDDHLSIRLKDGTAFCTVTEVLPEERNDCK
ncbi:MAG: exodeoxyribonuclease VII large subunit [Acutalibacteraceae bacterium]